MSTVKNYFFFLSSFLGDAFIVSGEMTDAPPLAIASASASDIKGLPYQAPPLSEEKSTALPDGLTIFTGGIARILVFDVTRGIVAAATAGTAISSLIKERFPINFIEGVLPRL